MTKKRPLTKEEKNKIWAAISRSMTPDDKDPDKVIRDSYNGDTDAYLRAMASWHNIPIGED